MSHTDAATTLEFIKILTERVGEEKLEAKIKTLTLKVLAEMEAEKLAQQAAPAAREPLTDEQIETMLNENFGYKDMHTFARAIEAAHGIKEQK